MAAMMKYPMLMEMITITGAMKAQMKWFSGFRKQLEKKNKLFSSIITCIHTTTYLVNTKQPLGILAIRFIHVHYDPY